VNLRKQKNSKINAGSILTKKESLRYFFTSYRASFIKKRNPLAKDVIAPQKIPSTHKLGFKMKIQ
jgi:hypothetical protein